MRKRNLLIFTLVVVLMTAMSAPVFAGSKGDRPEHKKTHTDKVYAAKKGSISVDTRLRIREDRAHVRVRVNQGAAKKTTLYTTVYLLKSSKEGAVHGKKCFHRPKRPGQRYLGRLQQGAFLQEKIKNN